MIAKLLDRALAAAAVAATTLGNALYFFTTGETLFYEMPIEDCSLDGENKDQQQEGSQS